MKNRLQLLKALTRAVNTTQGADCTLAQVDYWVGSDTDNATIQDYLNEVLVKSPSAPIVTGKQLGLMCNLRLV